MRRTNRAPLGGEEGPQGPARAQATEQPAASERAGASERSAGATERSPGGAERAPVGAERGGERPTGVGEAQREGRRRRGLGWRTRSAGASAAGAVGSGVLAIARLVMLAASLIALLIALAIVLRDVDANASNTIVKGIHEGANFFAGAFTGLISFTGHPKRAITVNWGIALLVYLLVGAVISRYIARIGRGGLRIGESRRAALR